MVRTDATDTCGLLTDMTQLCCVRRARVLSHSVTAWMRLASDMRARRDFDRLTPAKHVQGGAAERAGAIASRHPGERTGSDGSDGAARSLQV